MPEDPELERDRLTAYSLRQSRRYAGAVYASSSTGTCAGEDDDDNDDDDDDNDIDNDNDDDDDDDDNDDDDDDGDYKGKGAGYPQHGTRKSRRSSRLALLPAGSAPRGRYQLGSGSNDLRSSWRADPSSPSSSPVARDPVDSAAAAKDRMVDVRLDQSHLDLEAGQSLDTEPFLGFHKPPQHHRPRGRPLSGDCGHGSLLEMPRDDSPPPSFQQFKRLPRERSPSLPFATPQPHPPPPPPPPSSPPPPPPADRQRDRPDFLPQETKRAREPVVCHPVLWLLRTS